MGGFGTPSVAVATTPTVVSTFFSHIFARSRRKSAAKKSIAEGGTGYGPESDLTYEEGLKVVRRFIDFSSHRGVEEVQAFTAMVIPAPHWVKKDTVKIPQETILKAEEILATHLSSYGTNGTDGGGLNLVGGSRWWRVRGRELEGEWIEMQKHYLRRKARQKQGEQNRSTEVSSPSGGEGESSTGTGVRRSATSSSWSYNILPKRSSTLQSARSIVDNSGHEVQDDRVILYIHGGAFFFSSLDTHRYQVQRHARKAGARCFSPAYRLAPQYPFPCGLLDSLASYLYLIDPPPGVHAPISPTSIIFMGDSAGGGMCISLLVLIREMGLPMPAGASLISPWVDLTHSMPSISGAAEGDFIPQTGFHYKPSSSWPPLPGNGVKLEMPDGQERLYEDQVQMYCPNDLLTHPLVSPVNQGSLGGLCPLLILGGGGELLRDEVIYLAHKAANPALYSPSSRTLAQYPDQIPLIEKYKPTKVHLQIYEGCCHVIPTLSWTSPAKYMYRQCANFNIWAFTAAAKGLEYQMERRRDSTKSHKSHKHHHNHSSSNRPEPPRSKSQTTDDASRSSTLKSGVASLTLSSPSDATASTSNGQITSTPPSSLPSSATPSAKPSMIDLTKPIIDKTAANQANQEEVEFDDLESECSSLSEEDTASIKQDDKIPSKGIVTVSGTEPFPPPGEYIVSERVSIHGRIRPFEPINVVPALHPDLKEHIGQISSVGAIQKWLTHRQEWDEKYTKEKEKWMKIKKEDREKAEKEGFLTRDLKGENPPLCSLVGWYDEKYAREVGKSVDEIGGKRTGGAVMLWMKMSSKADKEQAGGESLAEIKRNVEEEIQEEQAIEEGFGGADNGDGNGNGNGPTTDGIKMSPSRQRRRSSAAARQRRRSSAAATKRPVGVKDFAIQQSGPDRPVLKSVQSGDGV